MIELIWGILNVAIFIYFIIICFKVIKIVRENLGGIAMLVFVVGLISFMSTSDSQKEKIKIFEIKDESIIEGEEKIDEHIFTKDLILDDELSTSIIATFTFKEYGQQFRVLKVYTMMTGFVSGTDWKASNVAINKNNGNSYNYHILGTKDWKILGIIIYTESKEFKGTVKL